MVFVKEGLNRSTSVSGSAPKPSQHRKTPRRHGASVRGPLDLTLAEEVGGVEAQEMAPQTIQKHDNLHDPSGQGHETALNRSRLPILKRSLGWSMAVFFFMGNPRRATGAIAFMVDLSRLARHPALEHLKLPKSGSKEVLCLNETAALGAGGT